MIDPSDLRVAHVRLPEGVETILTWARSLPPNETIGVCGDPLACILAKYLIAHFPGFRFCLGPSAGSGPGHYYVTPPYGRGDSCTLDLPPAINAFAIDFDDLRGPWQRHDHVPLTAAEFLRRWETRKETGNG